MTPESIPPSEPTVAIPAGLPPWITPALVNHTRVTWQPFYPNRLTVADAIDILLSVSNLFATLRDAARPRVC